MVGSEDDGPAVIVTAGVIGSANHSCATGVGVHLAVDVHGPDLEPVRSVRDRQAECGQGQHPDHHQPRDQEQALRVEGVRSGDGEPVVGETQYEHCVTEPEPSEDAEHPGYRALADGSRPDCRDHQAQAGGRDEDGERCPDRRRGYVANKDEPECDRSHDETGETDQGRVSSHRLGRGLGGRFRLGG